MLGIPVGFMVFGCGEWAVHRYLLHGRANHWLGRGHEAHHEAASRHGGYDPAYEGPVWGSSTQLREVAGLFAVGALHAPLFAVAPFYTATIWYCLARYRRDHRRAHLDPAWARDHLPWHYAHHLGDPARNFGVAWSWLDAVAGTREVFVGSERERAGLREHAARAAAASAGAALRAQRRRPLRRLLGRPADSGVASRGRAAGPARRGSGPSRSRRSG